MLKPLKLPFDLSDTAGASVFWGGGFVLGKVETCLGVGMAASAPRGFLMGWEAAGDLETGLDPCGAVVVVVVAVELVEGGLGEEV